MRNWKLALCAAAASIGLGGTAYADADTDTTPAPAATPAAPAPAPMTTPAMSVPLSANPNPFSVDAGPFGKVYVTGAVTGLVLTQDHHIPGDKTSWGDMSNAQVFIQKTDGPVQFFIQAGAYSLPDLGTPYIKATAITPLTYGVVSQAFLKFVPNSDFNIIVGKLPTLIGAEYTFSFENTDSAMKS